MPALLIATPWTYRARYFSTCSGPPNGGLLYTTQSRPYCRPSQAANAPSPR